jgi:hypothetical protein
MKGSGFVQRDDHRAKPVNPPLAANSQQLQKLVRANSDP